MTITIPASARERARARKKQQILKARECPVAFMEYVMRDTNPGTYGQRIECEEFHRDWQHHMEDNLWWLIEAPVGHGKTTSLTSRILWRMGKFPERRVAILGGVADKTLKEVRQYIERSVELHEVFPDLVPSEDPSDPWTDQQITIKRPFISKDPTLQVAAELGDIVGSRIDDLYLDDILNLENTNTEYSRKKTITWIDSTCNTRVTPQIGRIGIIGTPWHPEDALAIMQKRPAFKAYKCSAVENPDDEPHKWRPIWARVWPLAELLKIKANSSDHDFQRTRLCRVRLDATSRFKESWVLRCAIAGRGLGMAPTALRVGQRTLPHFTGVDLAAGKKATNARTSITTVALYDDGRLRPVEIDVGLYTGPETLDRLKSVHKRYGSTIMVESNAAQIYLVQFGEVQGIQIEAFYTGMNKWDSRFGVESLAVEFRQGLWIFPTDRLSDFSKLENVTFASEGLTTLITQALYFNPAEHTGDVLMSAWLARECSRRYSGSRTEHVNMLAR